MPLTAKDQKIMQSMVKSHGGDTEKAKREFYASATAGKLGRDVQKRHGAQYRGKKHAD